MSEHMEEVLRNNYCTFWKNRHGIISCKEVPVFSRSVDLVEYNALTKEITAVEFKISDWKRALKQLKCIEVCFDYLVLCVPNPKTNKCKTNIISTCESLGVGLYLWDKKNNVFSHECIEKNIMGIWHIQKESIIKYISIGDSI